MNFDARTHILNVKSELLEYQRSRRSGSGKTKDTDLSRSFRGVSENDIGRKKRGIHRAV